MNNQHVEFRHFFTKVFVFEDQIQVKSLGKNLTFRKDNIKSVSTGSFSRKVKVNLGGKDEVEISFGSKKDLQNFTDHLNGSKSFADLKSVYGTVAAAPGSKGTFFSRKNAQIFGVLFFIAALGSFEKSFWIALMYLIAGVLIFPKTYDLLRSKTPLHLSKNGRVIASFILLAFAGMAYSSSITPTSSSSPEVATTETKTATVSEKVAIGEQGYLRLPNITDSKQVICLGETKEDYEKVSKALMAKDYVGLLEIPGAFCVGNGSKVQVIDTGFGIRRVRILEGINKVDKDKVGLSGWTAMEWIVKN